MKKTQLLLSIIFAIIYSSAPGDTILLECEAFDNLGGWVIDQQFMDQMGSPFLLAHGLGNPVDDAETSLQFQTTGRYNIWARTRDWVAPWKAPGTPGKFQITVNGKTVDALFGTQKDQWHWQLQELKLRVFEIPTFLAWVAKTPYHFAQKPPKNPWEYLIYIFLHYSSL